MAFLVRRTVRVAADTKPTVASRPRWTKPGRQLADLLALAGLEEHQNVFAAAQIDGELAALMGLEDLKTLLPQVPLGQLLRLRQIFHDSPKLVYAPTKEPRYRFGTKFITSAVIDGQFKENQIILADIILVTGSLLLTISVGLLFSIPSQCSDGSACVMLRQADATLWTLSTWAFAVCSVTQLLCLITKMTDSSRDWPAMQVKMYMHQMTPMMAWVFGNQTMCGGFVTRILIQLPADLGTTLRVTLAVLLASFNVVGLSYSAYGIKKTCDVPWAQMPVAFLGCFLGVPEHDEKETDMETVTDEKR